MSKSVHRSLRGEYQKRVVTIFDSLSSRHAPWSIWADFVTMAAIMLSNAVDKLNAERRENTFLSIAKQYKEQELAAFSEMFGEIVLGMDANPDQDFLGELFMALELGNEHNGQFFTPYHVCKLMGAVVSGDMRQQIATEGWINANDCACGAGAMLIAFANECKLQGINYQESVLFTAQDIDFIAGCMCYIQLSLLGCAGYVVIADTLSNPSSSYDHRGLIPRHGENIWYTPFYFRDIWHWRRLWAQVVLLSRTDKAALETKHLQLPSDLPHQPTIALNETKTGQLTFF